VKRIFRVLFAALLIEAMGISGSVASGYYVSEEGNELTPNPEISKIQQENAKWLEENPDYVIDKKTKAEIDEWLKRALELEGEYEYNFSGIRTTIPIGVDYY